MKMRAYHRSWQQIDLTALGGTADAPAGPELYQKFYVELERGRGGPDQHWNITKRTLGEEVARHIFEQWARRSGKPPRILALAVGIGKAEGVWLERGFSVTLHDCQETSLRLLREEFPHAPVLLGDLRSMTIPAGFDIIVMLASEYMLSNGELACLMEKAATSFADGGCFVLHSVSILSIVRLAKQCVKWMIGHSSSGVFWGWLRTPAEFARSAKDAGLRVESAYRVGVKGSNTVLRVRSALLRTRPTLHDESVLYVLTRGKDPSAT